MLYAKQLAVITDAELQSAGQRAIDLARLQHERIAIPASFVILSTAFERMLSANNLKYKLDYLLARVDANLAYTLTNAYTGARKAFADAPMPTDVEQEAKELYESLSMRGEKRTPVRMILSPNRIDDPESNDSVIQCIRTPQEFLIALREAWALAYCPAQLAHRLRAKFPENKFTTAVIVQAMRTQDATVHAYSSLPQDKERIYLQVYRGYPDLRERVTKDYYAISKNDLKMVASEIREQQNALLLDEKDSLELAPVARKGETDHIVPRELAEIARITKRLERELGTAIKAFFSTSGDQHELMWINRLGFDVMLAPETVEQTTVAPQ